MILSFHTPLFELKTVPLLKPFVLAAAVFMAIRLCHSAVVIPRLLYRVDLPSLTSVIVDDGIGETASFHFSSSFSLKSDSVYPYSRIDLPSLTTVSLGNNCFRYASSIAIESCHFTIS